MSEESSEFTNHQKTIYSFTGRKKQFAQFIPGYYEQELVDFESSSGVFAKTVQNTRYELKEFKKTLKWT